MHRALRSIKFAAWLPMNVALQAGLVGVSLLGYRNGSRWAPALGVAANIILILVAGKWVRDWRRLYSSEIVFWFGYLRGISINAACLCYLSIPVLGGFALVAWSAVEFFRTREMTQLCVAVVGTVSLAICTLMAIRRPDLQRAPSEAFAASR